MKNILNFAKNISAIFALSLLVFSVSAFAQQLNPPGLSVAGVGKDYIDIRVTGGATYGAPAGFTLQWMLAADNANFGWNDPYVCKGSFSGNAMGQYYNLAPGQPVTLRVAKFDFTYPGISVSPECPVTLDCDTEYVFRAFAHNAPSKKGGFNKSDWSYLGPVRTLPCESQQGGCHSLGYYKTHYPGAWPNIPGLNLGNPFYDLSQLEAILVQPAGGNGLITISKHLITAKLNVAANPSILTPQLAADIQEGDNAIGILVVPPIGVDSLPANAKSDLVGRFNGLGYCHPNN